MTSREQIMGSRRKVFVQIVRNSKVIQREPSAESTVLLPRENPIKKKKIDWKFDVKDDYWSYGCYCFKCEQQAQGGPRLPVKKIHKSQKYSCKLCPKSFAKKSGLIRHQGAHSDLRPFTCSECGATFKRLESLRVHSIDAKRKKCDFCKVKIKCKTLLKRHINDHKTT